MGNFLSNQKKFNFIENNKSTDELNSDFKQLSSEVGALGSKIGVRIVPFRDKNVPFFAAQTIDRKKIILQDLSTYLKICYTTINGGYDLNNNAVLTWGALKEFGFRPTSDFFTYLTSEDIVEIHNREGLQIFRNFRFYDVCSYSLEELYCFPWTFLYSRDETIVTHFIEILKDILSGNVKSTVQFFDPPHIISEVKSPFLYQVDAVVRYGAPLFEDSNPLPAATIVLERARVMGPKLTAAEEEDLLKKYHQKLKLFDSNMELI